jgi:hypothetical protein
MLINNLNNNNYKYGSSFGKSNYNLKSNNYLNNTGNKHYKINI